MLLKAGRKAHLQAQCGQLLVSVNVLLIHSGIQFCAGQKPTDILEWHHLFWGLCCAPQDTKEHLWPLPTRHKQQSSLKWQKKCLWTLANVYWGCGRSGWEPLASIGDTFTWRRLHKSRPNLKYCLALHKTTLGNNFDRNRGKWQILD